MDRKRCAGCGEEKEITEFNYRNKRKGIRQYYCRACTRVQVRNHYQAHQTYYVRKARIRSLRVIAEQREWIANYLSGHPCVDCGEADLRCLDFDHVRDKKRSNISLMVGHFAWEAIEREIGKCDVRCSNCHRKVTSDRRISIRACRWSRP